MVLEECQRVWCIEVSQGITGILLTISDKTFKRFLQVQTNHVKGDMWWDLSGGVSTSLCNVHGVARMLKDRAGAHLIAAGMHMRNVPHAESGT